MALTFSLAMAVEAVASWPILSQFWPTLDYFLPTFCLFFGPRLETLQLLTTIYHSFGITGYGGLRPGIQNKKGFCIKINLPEGNY